MNDRFKFRLFNKAVKKFIYFDNSELCIDKENMGLLFRSEHLYLGNYEELQQSTGLKDKNGKLIFEGDILKDKYGALHSISWNIKGFYEADTFAVAGFYNAIQEDMEVIGNIYENKELLEDTDER